MHIGIFPGTLPMSYGACPVQQTDSAGKVGHLGSDGRKNMLI